MSTHKLVSVKTPSKMENLPKFSWKDHLILAVAGLFGIIASMPTTWPYIEETSAKAQIPVQLLVGGQIIQSAIWILLAVGVGLLLSGKTGLGAPILKGYLRRKS